MMKLVTFSTRAEPSRVRVGALLENRVIDLAEAWRVLDQADGGAGVCPGSLKALIAGGSSLLQRAAEAVNVCAQQPGTEARNWPRETVTLLPPIPDPGKFLCVGKNTRGHRDELSRTGLLKEVPREPTAFIKLSSVLVGDEAEVLCPPGISSLDYEPELAFVIARRAFGVKAKDAADYLGGILLLNDLTAREVQKREVESGTRFWTAKNMPGFGPVGPCIWTLDGAFDPYDLWVTCKVNGVTRLRSHTGGMLYRIGEIIEHFSRHVPLEVGDLIATGAPSGVAVGQPNAADLYLQPGDLVEIAFEGLSPSLRTRIVGDSSKGEVTP